MLVRRAWAAPARGTSAEASASSGGSTPASGFSGIDLSTACGPSAGGGDAQLSVPLGGRDREDRVVVRVRARRRGVAGLPLRVVVARSRARAGRAAVARGSPRSARSARRRLPAERTLAPSAISGAWRSPRGASAEATEQTLPPTVACPRISRSAQWRAAVASGSSPSSSAESGAVAPIVTLPSSRVTPSSPARESSSALSGRRRPEARSGITIVPPPITVTPPPSPKAAIASSAEAGVRTSTSASGIAFDLYQTRCPGEQQLPAAPAPLDDRQLVPDLEPVGSEPEGAEERLGLEAERVRREPGSARRSARRRRPGRRRSPRGPAGRRGRGATARAR